MDFIDKTIVRLADPATRGGVLDAPALESIISAGYNSDLLGAEPPYLPVFEEMQLGTPAPQITSASGTWQPVGSIERVEASFTVAAVGLDRPRIDALWRGAVVASVSRDTARIESVGSTWPTLGTIDADIESELGALPTDAIDLEDERRARLLERLRQNLDQQARFDDDRLDALLAGAGITSVSELLDRADGVVPAAVTVGFTVAPPPAPGPLALPVSVAVLVRDAGFSVAELLADTSLVRDRMAHLCVERPADPDLHRRNPLIALWVVPAATFDDVDWPGADDSMNPAQRRAARRAAAASWLANDGIALAALS